MKTPIALALFVSGALVASASFAQSYQNNGQYGPPGGQMGQMGQNGQMGQSGNQMGRRGPPQEAFTACANSSQGASCSVTTPHGTLSGTCQQDRHSGSNSLVCVPNGHRGGPPGGMQGGMQGGQSNGMQQRGYGQPPGGYGGYNQSN
ncbi:hypothetical protein [Magnetofaba australis]|uniref:hypothetical protein n=1 Tax=Magnetofaba australis TaxID=1472297 RepID=UPI000A19C4DF|nr:hypothetical protein [Magnetofaba australis]